MLYMLGSVIFQVQPTNVEAVDRTSGFDWAEKPLIGAAPDFEATGASPNITRLRGKIWPEMFGVGSFPALQAMASASTPFMLIRGDGQVFGWQVIRLLRERHGYLGRTGQGREIEFEIDLVSTPAGPGAAALMSLLQGLI